MGKKFNDKEWREANKEKLKEYNKKWREANKEKMKLYQKKSREKNKEAIKVRQKNYQEKRKEIRNKIEREKRSSDSFFALKSNIRASLRRIFKQNGFTKKSKTNEILGCSFEEFKVYIESKFESWMTWENRGLYNGEFNYGWDIDHIIPISTAKTEEDIIRLNHYTNLQPLCSRINRYVKKNKQ